MQLLYFKVFHTICMHQFGSLSERGGNVLNLLQKEGVPRKGGGSPSEKGGSNIGGDCVKRIVYVRDFSFAFLQRKCTSE